MRQLMAAFMMILGLAGIAFGADDADQNHVTKPSAVTAQTPEERAEAKAKAEAAKAREAQQPKFEQPLNTSVESKNSATPTDAQLKLARERLEAESAAKPGALRSTGSQGPRADLEPNQDQLRTKPQEGPNKTMNPLAPTPEMKTRTDTSPTKNDTEIKKQPEIR